MILQSAYILSYKVQYQGKSVIYYKTECCNSTLFYCTTKQKYYGTVPTSIVFFYLQKILLNLKPVNKNGKWLSKVGKKSLRN